MIFGSARVTAQYKQHSPFRDYYTARAIGSERVYERIYVGIGKHFFFGNADLAYKGYDTLGSSVDTSYTLRMRSKHSFVITAGTYFPFVLLSDVSTLAFSVELFGSYSDLTPDSVFLYPSALYKKSYPEIMLGVPVSLDFKTGGDVALSTKRRSMFTIGAGILIGGTSRDKLPSSGIPAPIPFLKLEAGTFAGIAIKLQGKIYFGDAHYVNRTDYNIFGNDELHTITHSNYGYNLSLILMPFSSGWRSEEWY